MNQALRYTKYKKYKLQKHAYNNIDAKKDNTTYLLQAASTGSVSKQAKR